MALHVRQRNPRRGRRRYREDSIQDCGRGDQAEPLLLAHVRKHHLALRRRLPRAQSPAGHQARPDRRPQRLRLDALPPRALPDVPVINFFEYYYRPHDPDSDMDFRKDLGWQVAEMKYLRIRCRNAMILLDLHNCQVGYYADALPEEPVSRANTIRRSESIFDGIDREHLPRPRRRRCARRSGTAAPARLPAIESSARHEGRDLLSVAASKSMRGFDIFMKAAKLICERIPTCSLLVVGTDRIAYGGDETLHRTARRSKSGCCAGQYDLIEIKFLGRVTPPDLGRMLAVDRPAHVSHRAVRAELEHDGRDELRRRGARLDDRPGEGNDPRRRERIAGRLLSPRRVRRQGDCRC